MLNVLDLNKCISAVLFIDWPSYPIEHYVSFQSTLTEYLKTSRAVVVVIVEIIFIFLFSGQKKAIASKESKKSSKEVNFHIYFQPKLSYSHSD